MSSSLIHLPVRYWLEYWPPLQGLLQCLTPSSSFGLWTINFSVPYFFAEGALVLLQIPETWPGLQSPTITFALLIWTCVFYCQHLCWCTPMRRQSILSPYFIVYKRSWHFIIVKCLSTIDQGKSKSLMLFVRKRIQKNHCLILFIDLDTTLTRSERSLV